MCLHSGDPVCLEEAVQIRPFVIALSVLRLGPPASSQYLSPISNTCPGDRVHGWGWGGSSRARGWGAASSAWALFALVLPVRSTESPPTPPPRSALNPLTKPSLWITAAGPGQVSSAGAFCKRFHCFHISHDFFFSMKNLNEKLNKKLSVWLNKNVPFSKHARVPANQSEQNNSEYRGLPC